MDVYHFVMTWEMFSSEMTIEELMKFYDWSMEYFRKGVHGNLNNFINDVSVEDNKLDAILDLTEKLGFSFDEVYQEYLNKNKENYDRLARGY